MVVKLAEGFNLRGVGGGGDRSVLECCLFNPSHFFFHYY